MKIIYKTVKTMNVRSRLLRQNKKQIMNINMKTVKSKFLHRALVLVNAYKCAKVQLPSSISYGGLEGSKKIGAADLLRRALAGKLLHVAIIPANGFLDRLVSEI